MNGCAARSSPTPWTKCAPPLSALAENAAKRSKSKAAAAEKDTLSDLMTLIDDIRGLAALYSDQETLTLDSFDLQAALETVRSLTTETFKARGWSMEATASNDAGWMIGDQGRICQMIYHCVLCALNGAPSGSTATVTVSVDGAEMDTMVVFAVAGPALDGKDQAPQWTGISLVKHIADLHGGYVDATAGEDGARSIICAVPSGT